MWSLKIAKNKLNFFYSHDPWNTPIDIQIESNCVIGKNYPLPIIDLNKAQKTNIEHMKRIRTAIIGKSNNKVEEHCRPSSDDEIRNFFWFSDSVFN